MTDEPRDSGPRHGSTNGNGFRSRSPHVHPVRFDEVSDEPIDLVAVQADDELISALAAGMSVSSPGVGGYDADDQVVAMLAAWRAEVDAEPLPEVVDLDTATASVLAAAGPSGSRRPSTRRPSTHHRYLVPLAAAAAMIVFTIGGVSIGASEARPGDPLWNVSKVLYSERAESVEAVARVEARIDAAKSALSRGEPEVAAAILAEAEQELVVVRSEEGLAELADLTSFLEAKAAETPPGQPTRPGTPLAADPTRPVPPRANSIEPLPASTRTSVAAPAPPAPEIAVAPEVAPPPPADEPEEAPPAEQPGTETSASVAPDAEGTPEDPPTSSSTAVPTAEGAADETSAPPQSLGSSESDGGTGTPTVSDTTDLGAGTPTASGASSENVPTS